MTATGLKLQIEDRKEVILANFQVRHILIDRILAAQMENEEVQELIRTRGKGKKKDLKVRETDGMLMQENRMYVPNNVELKKEILDDDTYFSLCYASMRYKDVSYH